MKKPKIYVHRLGSWYKLYMNMENEELLESFSEVVNERDREEPLTPSELIEKMKGSEAILSLNGIGAENEISYEILKAVGTVKFISVSHWWGQFPDVPKDSGISVVEGSNANTIAVAEWVISAALMGVRKIQDFDRSLKRGSLWAEPRRTVGMLAGKKVGLVGLGRIGSYVSKYFKALGTDVIVYDKYCPKSRAEELGVRLVSLEETFKADIVSLHLPVTNETKGMLGEKHFGLIKNGAVFINSARASLYDEQALIAELKKKRFSAYLDVFSIEPLPPGHPFRSMDNVTITPHIAGDNKEMFLRCGREAILTLKDYFEGKVKKKNIKPER
ncbi:MAG: hydroxyacid dehydrogenase [Candidatus Firestonebacteria bacterium]